jgi:hypothetical protein
VPVGGIDGALDRAATRADPPPPSLIRRQGDAFLSRPGRKNIWLPISSPSVARHQE